MLSLKYYGRIKGEGCGSIKEIIKYNLKIADIYFEVESFPDEYAENEFRAYMVDSLPNEDAVKVKCIRTTDKIPEPCGEKLTLKGESNWYREKDGRYSLCFYDSDNDCICAVMTYDNNIKQAEVTLLDVYNLFGIDTEYFLHNIMEYAFRMTLLFHGGFAVHASSIAYKGFGIAFSAESGTGKSTHTDLWLKNYPGAYILNDDGPALRLMGDKWYIYGTPWAGTSGINVNAGVELKALVFLERNETNVIRDCPTGEAIKRIFDAIVHPMSDEITDIVFDSVSKFFMLSRVCVLGCNMSDEAPETVKEYLF